MILAWRSSRWCGLAFCGFAIVLTLLGTLVRLFFLTLPGEVVKVGPFVMDAALLLFAIILGAALLLPGVVAASASKVEPAAADSPLAE